MRIKSTTTPYQSRLEFENVLDQLGALTLQLEAEVATYNEKKAAEDKRFKNAIKAKKAKIVALFKSCESYASHHKGELMGEKQSAETRVTNYGFRKSPGVVKTLNSKWTLAKAKDALKSAGKLACLKITETLDKNAVKKNLSEPEMAEFGLKMDFPEEFWVEPKKELETELNK